MKVPRDLFFKLNTNMEDVESVALDFGVEGVVVDVPDHVLAQPGLELAGLPAARERLLGRLVLDAVIVSSIFVFFVVMRRTFADLNLGYQETIISII